MTELTRLQQLRPEQKIAEEEACPDSSAKNPRHAVGALFVGAPWEIIIPTELVYLRNKKDKLPVYPLS